MTAKNIQKIINKKNSTWGVLKLIRKEELFFFSLSLFAARQPRKFEHAKMSSEIIDFGGQNVTENNKILIHLL